MLRRLPIIARVFAILTAIVLVACGNGAATSTQPAPTADATSSLAVVPSTTTVEATAPPAMAPTATVAAAGAEPTTNSPYAALPQSQTAEGYYVLGQPDAPLVIQFYSDFL